MGIGESGTTIKMAEQAPDKVWCEAGEHWVHEDEYDREYEMCIDCRERRTKEWE